MTNDGTTGRRNDGPVSRREFLGAAVASAFLGHITLHPDPRPVGPSARRSAGSFPLGLQLYAVRDVIKADLPGTLAALAAMGYREVELAGLYARTAAEFRALLDAAGLKAPAGHVGVPALTDEIEQTIADAKTLGHRYLILPWIGEEYRTVDGWRRAAELLNRAGAQCRAAGLHLGYHNHDFEFLPVGDGDAAAAPTGYDLLLRHTDPKLVMFELDLFWIRKGGRDALAYLREHRGRFRSVHIKDMAADGAMVDVGQGVMDWKTLLHAARRAGVKHFFAEHDEAKDQLAFARVSATYLKTLRL